MDIKDIVVGQFIIATDVIGSDNNVSDKEVFTSGALEVGAAYEVLEVDEQFEGDTQPILVAVPTQIGHVPEGWWCHPKYFTAQESK